jgi:serine/threonine-protein kinase
MALLGTLTMHDLIGRTLGHYRIVEKIGEGGMGEVYRAHDIVLDVPIAVKFVRSSGSEYRDRMFHEVRLAREVTNPAVCRVYDVGETEGQLYFTMEYVDGEDLSSLLKRIGRLPSEKVTEIAHQILAGLAAAHAQGVIHRDLKPANIMVDGKGRVRITDFGIAVLETDVAEGTLAGTPSYMAPEQLTGGDVGPATDLYAVGLILHELLTGKAVFRGGTFSDIFTQKMARQPAPPSESVAGVDDRLEAAISRAVSREVTDRPKSAVAMAAAIPGGNALAMAVEAGVTPDPSLVAAATVEHKVERRYMWALLTGLVVLLVGVVLLADSSWRFSDLAGLESPGVLADRAEQMLRDMGYAAGDMERNWGFLNNPLALSPIDTAIFWYRERTPREVPSFAEKVIRVGSLDSDFQVPESVSHETLLVMLDSRSRLVYLHEGPTFGANFAASGSAGSEFDWSQLLGFASLDETELVAEDDPVLPVFSDACAVWTGDDPDLAEGRLSVQAAAFDGRPVYFSVEQVDERSRNRWQQLRRRSRLRSAVERPLYVAVVLAALGLGVVNLLKGRTHIQGAATLVVAVLVVEVLTRLMSLGHVSHPLYSSKMVMAGGSYAIVVAALGVGLCYLGMEPFARRHRPQTLIAWNRLLAGRLGDPAVGTALLAGAGAGVSLTVISEFDRIALRWVGLDPTASLQAGDRLNSVLGLGPLFAAVFDHLNTAIVGGILLMFLAVALGLVVRKGWLASSLFVAVVAAIWTIQDGAHLPVSLLTNGLPAAALILFLLLRFGLLAVVVAQLAERMLACYPITAEPGAWFAQGGFFAVGMVLLIGAVGFLAAYLSQPALENSDRESAGSKGFR